MAKAVELIPIDDNGQEITLQPDRVPKWGEQNPNIYAGVMTALDLVPMVGNLAKTSGVGIPLAGGLNVLSQAVKREINDQPQTLGGAATDFLVGAGGQAVGDVIGKGVLPTLGRMLPKSVPEKLYQSAVKPSTVTDMALKKAMLRRGLDEGITLDEAGFNRLIENIRGDRSLVDDIINRGSAAGDTIPAQSVIDQFSQGGDKSLTYLANLLRDDAPEVGDALTQRIATIAKGGPDIDVKKAQGLKEHYQSQANYKKADTRGMYDEQIDRATATGYRKAIEDAYGGEAGPIAQANARNAERINLAKQLNEKGTIGRIDNRDPLGFQLGLAQLQASVDITNPMTQANFIARAIQNFPKPMAKMAIKMYEGQTGKKLPASKWRTAVKYFAQGAITERLNELNNPSGQFDDVLGLRYAE